MKRNTVYIALILSLTAMMANQVYWIVRISASDIKHVFDRFYRADRREVRRKTGFGLGLTYVKSIVEAHGGRMEANSGGVGFGSDEETHALRHRDMQVLSVLLQRENKMITRKELLHAVWKDDSARLNTSLDSSISRIRALLKHYPGIKIKKVYGGGYGIV